MLAGAEEALQGMKSVRILMARAIDYAGFFPPAGLALHAAVRNYRTYGEGPHAWALGRFVVPQTRVEEAGLAPDTVAVVAGPSETAGNIEYLERPLHLLAEVKDRGARAKVRTGGLTPEAFPDPEALANFIVECARLKLPFKATAGLHHALRGTYPVTYEPDSAAAMMHGFLNVLLASCLAWHGGDVGGVRATLEETDAAAFRFDDSGATWNGYSLSNAQLAAARAEFMMSFGSCSFEEPIEELQSMGLL
jgi:hypothetical protein